MGLDVTMNVSVGDTGRIRGGGGVGGGGRGGGGKRKTPKDKFPQAVGKQHQRLQEHDDEVYIH